MQTDPVDNGRGAVAIADRADLPRGLLNTAWPLLALALLLLMLLRTCVPVASAPPPAAPFDPAAAAGQANAEAAAALRALPAQPGLAETLAALDRSAISFAAGSDVLPGAAEPLLRAAARAIAALPAGARIVIRGHDDGGPAAPALAQRRADAVRDRLIGDGAPAESLRAEPAAPLAEGEAAPALRNRRIAFAAP